MKIAVLGISTMGFLMARRLCGAVHEVHVWNRTPVKAECLCARHTDHHGGRQTRCV
jgi:3-hydroxyisobutyrate dehydrogenase-like beta-hydroxyacid dehydrogenase